MPSLADAYNAAVDFCNDDNITYDRTDPARTTIYNYYFLHSAEKGQCDCSSFIYYALMAGGFDVVNSGNFSNTVAWWTGNMGEALENLGFSRYNYQVGLELKKGDILVKPGHHTEMVYTEGTADVAYGMGAHGNENDGVYILSKQVEIDTQPLNCQSWVYVYRYEGQSVENKKVLSRAIGAALLGNAIREGLMRPSQRQGGGDLNANDYKNSTDIGGGLFQWTNTTGSPRLYNLYKHAASKSRQAATFEEQANYLVEEYKYTSQNPWIYHTVESHQYPWTSLEEFLAVTDDDEDTVTLATWAFQNAWERGTGFRDFYSTGTQNKIESALEIYSYLLDHYADDVSEMEDNNEGTAWTDVKRNNAVYFYQLLNGELGGYISTTDTEKAYTQEHAGDPTVDTGDSLTSLSDLMTSMGLLVGLLAMGSFGNSTGSGKYKTIGKRGRSK